MKHVLFLNEIGEIAGTEVLLATIMAHLDRSRYTPVIACPSGPIVDRIIANGIEHVPFNFKLRRLKTGSLEGGGLRIINPVALAQKVIEGFAIAKIAKQREINILHANSLSAYIAGIVAARRTGLPIVWHIHTYLPNLLYKFTFPDAMIFVSDFVLHAAFPGRIPGPAHRIYNGIDLAAFDPTLPVGGEIRREFGIRPDQPLVVMIGYLDKLKGQHEVLQAWSSIATNYPHAKLLLVGKAISPRGEAYEAQLRNQIQELGINQSVIFAGYRSDIPSILGAADVYVSFTLNDTLSMVVIEAMSMAKAIIGANSGGLPELIAPGESGLLVNKGDITGLATAIDKLLGDADMRKRFGESARQRALSQFDIATCVSKIQSIYDEISR